MRVEAIWEMLEMRNNPDNKVGIRDSLKAHRNPKMSQPGGATVNSQDAWVRKLAAMYDNRLTTALAGTGQFNLVADASTHAGGLEVLVSLLWSRENNVGAFYNLHHLIPGKVLDPQELELTSIIELMAKG